MTEIRQDLEHQITTLKSLREKVGLNRTEFAKQQGIPLRTIEDWEAGRRQMPDYLLRLLVYKVSVEQLMEQRDNRISIIQDEQGKSIVIINDIRFKSRRNIDWKQIEEYL